MPSLLLLSLFISWTGTQKREPEKPVVVVELFTSEGCSSCPPADRLLSEIVDEEYAGAEVFALSFHVDYWDYIGWKDPYADKQFSDRQRAYAKRFRSSQIYTPQMIVNGRHEFVGSNRSSWQRTFDIEKRKKNTCSITVNKLERSGNELTVEVSSSDSGRVKLNVAVVERSLSQDVKRGENRGRKLAHDNVVRSFQSRTFDGSANRFNLTLPEDLEITNANLIIYVQNQENWEVLGAIKHSL